MNMDECIFCRIAHDTIPADKVFEDERFVVFRDIHPKAPVHLLLVPRKHIESVDALTPEDQNLAGALLLLARDMARKENMSASGYKLALNVGRGGGQLIDHLHLHLLGGWERNPTTFTV